MHVTQKPACLAYLNLNIVFPNTFPHICSFCSATDCGETEMHLFVLASKYLKITLLTHKQVKNPKQSAIMNHILLDCHNATYNDSGIFLPETMVGLN